MNAGIVELVFYTEPFLYGELREKISNKVLVHHRV